MLQSAIFLSLQKVWSKNHVLFLTIDHSKKTWMAVAV